MLPNLKTNLYIFEYVRSGKNFNCKMITRSVWMKKKKKKKIKKKKKKKKKNKKKKKIPETPYGNIQAYGNLLLPYGHIKTPH